MIEIVDFDRLDQMLKVVVASPPLKRMLFSVKDSGYGPEDQHLFIRRRSKFDYFM